MRITRKTWLSASDGNSFVPLPLANARMWKSPLKLHVLRHVFVVMSRPGGKSRDSCHRWKRTVLEKSTWKYSKHKYSRQALSSDRDTLKYN